MKALLAEFENKAPEIVLEWRDPESEAVGWVVINSLRNGSAGGGIRMRKGLDKDEVLALAKTMEVKFTVSGPPIGGAKSGIDFDPYDPRKRGVLERWFRAITPLLKFYYGTGGDMNVDEVNEVIPMTEEQGLWHPQEGTVNGYYKPTESEKIKKIGQLRMGVSKVVEDPELTPDPKRKFVVADLITGYGVAESVKHFYDLHDDNIEGKRVIVQGWGNVGAAGAFYLALSGATVVGIIDRKGGIIKEEGLSTEEVRELMLSKKGNELNASNMESFDSINERIWDLPAEVFIPCAGSRLVTQEQVSRMMDAGMETIACGANVPFADEDIFFGPIADHVDENITLIPDFISNCGMARVFAYCHSRGDIELSDKSIFLDTSETLRRSLKDIQKKNPARTGVAKTAFEIALKQLV